MNTLNSRLITSRRPLYFNITGLTVVVNSLESLPVEATCLILNVSPSCPPLSPLKGSHLISCVPHEDSPAPAAGFLAPVSHSQMR